MSRESILKLKEAEAEAARIVSAAHARATEIVSRAEDEGRALCEDTERQTKEALGQTLGQIRERTVALSERIEAEGSEEIEELQKRVELRRRIAEKIIVRGVEKKCR